MANSSDEGIIPPEEMIDHNNANFAQIENILGIFVAYNQANIQKETDWDAWPEWELCLTEMNADIHFEYDDDSDEIKVTGSLRKGTKLAKYYLNISYPAIYTAKTFKSFLMI